MGSFSVDSYSVEGPAEYGARMLIIGARDGTSVKNVLISREDITEGMTLEQYRTAHFEQMKKTAPGIQTVKVGKVVIAGKESPLLELHNVGPRGLPIANLVAYYVAGKFGYAFVATHVRGPDFDRARPEFQKIFESFKPG